MKTTFILLSMCFLVISGCGRLSRVSEVVRGDVYYITSSDLVYSCRIIAGGKVIEFDCNKDFSNAEIEGVLRAEYDRNGREIRVFSCGERFKVDVILEILSDDFWTIAPNVSHVEHARFWIGGLKK
jgi:hypothetical protein